MRLVCPNCNAQYEVDAAVIPDEGRDVLCSNCGHAWFQMSERQLAAAAADEQAETPVAEATAAAEANAEAVAEIVADESPADGDRDAARTAAAAAATTAASVQAAAEEAVAARIATSAPSEALGPEDFAPETANGEAATDEEGAAEAAAASPAPRRTLDDEMLSVLREEAARESEARRAEGSSIETQPELGLPEAEARQPTIESIGAATVRAQRRRNEELAEEAGAREAATGPEAPAPANRKALLPDIEEINSTLTASSERRDLPSTPDEIDRRRSRSGFRAGFSVSFLIALALLLLYVSAPRLSQGLPALAPALERYVASVDAGRIWLDARLRNPGASGSN